MKILVVCSGNSGDVSPFVKEQADAIVKLGNEVAIYPIVGKGLFGYLRNLPTIRRTIREFSPELVHAHYALSGLAASLQRLRPVVVTYHGSDGHVTFVRAFSRVASRLSSSNIFVEKGVKQKIRARDEGKVIPCGTRLDTFFPMDKKTARLKLGLDLHRRYILFSSRFDNKVKNYPLAAAAVQKSDLDLHLIELRGKTREEVNLLLNACDSLLLTSFSEGSPQIIKEAMACNCPIVSTDVGDVRVLIGGIAGCYITSFDPAEVAAKLKETLNFSENVGRTNGRQRLIELQLDSESVARRVIQVYQSVL